MINRTLSRIALGVVSAGALFAAACGGGGSSSGPADADFNKDPVNFARVYYLTSFRALTGATQAEDLMRLFEESCRNKVAVADVSKALEKARADGLRRYPKLAGAKIEDFDFQGKAKVTKTDKGAKVIVPGVKDSRVKVDGKYLNAAEYFKSVGFMEDGDKDDPTDTELVLVNGRYYYADCENLTDAADSGKRASETPTPPRGTATPVRTTPTVTTDNRTPTPSATSRTGASSNLSDSDVEAYTKRYYSMIFSVYTGQFKYDDVISFYTSECRAKVKLTDVMAGLLGASNVFPKLRGENIEDLDFGGKLKITSTSGGYTVELPGTREIRIKVNGSFVNMHTYMQNTGLESASATGNETSKQGFIVQNGKLYDVDCEFLEKLAK